MRNWKLIAIPDLMKDLELDSRGFPIPYVVLRDKNNKPYFTINDEFKTEKCLEKDLCSICGKELRDDKWMIGGPKSTFHPQGCFIDIPVHKSCGEYALKVCPYLAVSRYTKRTDINSINTDDLEHIIFVDPTQDDNRVPFFCFIKISGFNIRRSGTNRYIYPVKPYLQHEFWNNGEQINVSSEQLYSALFD